MAFSPTQAGPIALMFNLLMLILTWIVRAV
jgi:hypothetical protein